MTTLKMKKSGLASKICPDVWRQAYVVNCQAVGTGANSIKYLAPYVIKVAISNKRIVKLEDGHVFFKYKKSGSNRWRTMDLKIIEFIRRFLPTCAAIGFYESALLRVYDPCIVDCHKKNCQIHRTGVG